MDDRDRQKETESWGEAEKYVRSLGRFSTLCTAPIRTVLASPGILHTTAEVALKKFAVDSLLFTLKVSPSLKASLYHAASEMRQIELAQVMPCNLRRLMECFSAYELCIVVSLSYFSSLLKHQCDESEINRLYERAAVHMKIGEIVGGGIQGLGRSNGIFLAGLRLLSLAVLLKNHLENFKKYRRWIESNNLFCDLGYEERIWGCNHLQIASVIVSALGYGIIPRIAFGLDIEAKVFSPYKPAIEECLEEIQAWRAGIILSESLNSGADINSEMISNFHGKLDENALQEMKKGCEAIFEEKQGFGWIRKGISDLPSEVCEQLNIEPKAPKEDNAVA